jgi:hypothetical protein
MADNILFPDDSIIETRRNLSTATFGLQTFANSPTDNSYSLNPASSSSRADSQDYYRLAVTRQSTNVILALSNLTGNADIQLLDSGGNSIAISSNGGAATDAIVLRDGKALDVGTYYIRVFAPDASVTTNYTLTVNTNPSIRADPLFRNIATGANGLWVMNGTQRVQGVPQPTVSDLNWSLKGTADFNGDLQTDLLWRNPVTGRTSIWLMDNKGRRLGASVLPYIEGNNWDIAAIGKFRDARNTDIVWYNRTTGQGLIWLMNGTRYEETIDLPTEPDPNWFIRGAGDFNGDGHTDIVWRNMNGDNRLWLMNGTTFQSQQFIRSQTNLKWQFGGIGDFDADGNLDIIWRELEGSRRNIVWFMNQMEFRSQGELDTAIADLNWRIVGVAKTPPLLDMAGFNFTTAYNMGTVDLPKNSSGAVQGNSVVYMDGIGGIDRQEYYRFNLSANSKINLSLSGLADKAEVQLIRDTNNNGLIDQNELLATKTLTAAEGSTLTDIKSVDIVTNFDLAAGTYFVRLYDNSAERLYSLRLATLASDNVNLTYTSLRLDKSSAHIRDAAQTVEVTYGIKNIGGKESKTFKVAFYLSYIPRSQSIASSDKLLTDDQNRPITRTYTLLAGQEKIGEKQKLRIPTAVDTWWGGDKTYYVIMVIDPMDGSFPTGQVLETNETDNLVNQSISITGTTRPDLEGGGLSVSAIDGVANPGDRLFVTGTVLNKGNSATPSGAPLYVSFVFSTDDYYDTSDAFIVQQVYLNSIAAQSSIQFNTNMTSTALPAYFTPDGQIQLPNRSWSGWKVGTHTYYLCMEIDTFGQINEGDLISTKENNLNYGRLRNQYLDYAPITVTVT